jgi:hypothetical protein
MPTRKGLGVRRNGLLVRNWFLRGLGWGLRGYYTVSNVGMREESLFVYMRAIT